MMGKNIVGGIEMVFLNSIYKSVVLFIATAIFLLVMDFGFGIVIWPGLFFSYQNFVVLFIFALCIVLAANY